MVDINEEIKKIKNANFFEKMGVDNIHENDVILIGSVRKVFIEPSNDDFKGLYKETEWLPTSPTQNDPFYEKQVSPKELIELRKEINKCIIIATRELDKGLFPLLTILVFRQKMRFALRLDSLLLRGIFLLGAVGKELLIFIILAIGL